MSFSYTANCNPETKEERDLLKKNVIAVSKAVFSYFLDVNICTLDLRLHN